MKEYKGFPVSNYRTGFDEAVEPWLLPRDAVQVLQNAHLYRGVIEKINGYDAYTKMSYRTIVQMTGTINGVNKTFTITLTSALTTNSFTAQSTTNAGATQIEIFTYLSDASATLINLKGSLGGTGTIDLTNPNAPVVSITFNTAPVSILVGGVQYNAVIFTYDGPPLNPMTGALAYKPIMGIKPYYEISGAQDILIFDTRRVGKVVAITSIAIGSLLSLDYGIEEIPHEVQTANITITPAFDGVTKTFHGTIVNPIVPGMVTFYLYTNVPALVETITDNGDGLLTGTAGATGFINYFTGQWTITFVAAPPATNTMNTSVCMYGDVFTGDFTNFFSVCNYTFKAFITNNIDEIRYYDGHCLFFLDTNLEAVAVNSIAYDISTCLFVEVNRERLLLVSPVVDGVPVLNGIYWSKAGDPLDFTNDEQLLAPTSEAIRTYKIINSDMIVRFSNSERIFRYTGDAFSPFRWDSTNAIWRTDAPYSAINYDTYFTAVGKPAIIASDGVNIRRADEIIPDFTDPYRIDQQSPALFLDQTSIGQCYGERFDDLKEGWMCYKSSPNESDTVEPSDSILAFNYLDQTYAIYTFPFSCLGFGSVITTLVWGNDYREWGSIQDTWGSYEFAENSLVDLSGDQFGNVFLLDNSNMMGANKTGDITNVSTASPAVVTSTAHGLYTGDQIVIQNVIDTIGFAAINNQQFVVTVIDANTFSVPFDTTLLPDYVSGGNWFTMPVIFEIITKNFNPFVEEGQLSRLGYVDLFVSANDESNFRVQFYADDMLDYNFNTYYQETMLTLTAGGQTKVWKRIYVGAVAKEHTLRIYQNLADFSVDTIDQPVKVHAIIPYFKPAGRIFN